MNQLTKYDQARTALSIAVSVDEVKNIIDKTAALKEYARRANDKQMIIWATSLQLDAERKAGEMLRDMQKAKGGDNFRAANKITCPTPVLGHVEQPKTLEEQGITYNQSSKWQAIAELDVDTLDAIKNGEKSLKSAISDIKKQQRKEKHQATVSSEKTTTNACDIFSTDKKFRVVYADPPWSYNDKCENGGVQAGGALRHYSTMSIKQICDLPVKNIIDKDAVLFMWVTSPLLEESFEVIKAWGFKYKSSFIWDKIVHNMGHYNSVRHEFLLICTRGSCVPDEKILHDSVVSIERGKHSEKPIEFLDIIDSLYTYGHKLEMFARDQKKPSWYVFGNEV